MALVLALAGALAAPASPASPASKSAALRARPYTVVLGIAQDGGVPQAGCTKACCAHGRHELVSSLALVDPATRRWWLFDATPDMGAQLVMMRAKRRGVRWRVCS